MSTTSCESRTHGACPRCGVSGWVGMRPCDCSAGRAVQRTLLIDPPRMSRPNPSMHTADPEPRLPWLLPVLLGLSAGAFVLAWFVLAVNQ